MNSGDLVRRYMYPDAAVYAPIEYAWSGFSVVLIMGAADDVETVSKWCEANFPDVLDIKEEDDYTIFSFASGDFHLSDATKASALEGLQAFFGSKVLTDFCQCGKYKSIGVLRFHDW
jgi:hypothetical protein